MGQTNPHHIDYYSWVPQTLKGLDEQSAPLLFDIETDGLLDTLTTIHSIVIRSAATNTIIISAHHDTIQDALFLLANAPIIAGHNIISFDIPAITKLYPLWQPQGRLFDTLNASRLIWPELKLDDFIMMRKKQFQHFPKRLIGSHSLEAWGYRLGIFKGEFGKTANWNTWSTEMQTYCEQDVTVTHALFNHILSQNYSQQALALEMDFQQVITKQELHGFPFNTQKAEQLYVTLASRREAINTKLQHIFPPVVREEIFIPKVNNKTKGYVKGVPFIKKHEEIFNPNSGYHISARLKEKYNWTPATFTPTGEPTLDEETLATLPYPEAKLLSAHRGINKIISMLAEGKAGWLKLVTPQNRIHGRVITNGAVTGRCTHSKPNLGQVPRRGDLGKQCRELFEAPQGYKQVGADASGLELRVFGHFLARYDNGRYAKEVVEGDIHTANQHAAGLPSRDDAKTFIYAFLYGAGPVLLGTLLVPDGTDEQKKRAGLAMKRRFLSRTPVIKQLIDDISTTLETRKHLRGIDGRRLTVRSKHSALNLIFQSAGALLVKLATVLWHNKLAEQGLVCGEDYAQVAHVHDEVQAIAKPELAEKVGNMFVEAIEEAGRHFGFRVPMTGECKIGKNWQETH